MPRTSSSGEYVTPVPLPAMRALHSGLQGLRRLWRDVLRQGDPGDLAAKVEAALSIPFIDYARGDGIVDRARWRHRLDPDRRRRRDRLDRWFPRPVGPRHPRPIRGRASAGRPQVHAQGDGSPVLERSARVPRPGQAAAARSRAGGPPERIAALSSGARGDRAEAEAKADGGPRVRRRRSRSGPRRWCRPSARRRTSSPSASLEEELAGLRARDAALDDDLEVTTSALGRAEAGDLGDPRAHLRQDHRPQPPESQRYGRIVEFWSAISAGLLVIVLVGTMLHRLGPDLGRRADRGRWLRRDRGRVPAAARASSPCG